MLELLLNDIIAKDNASMDTFIGSVLLNVISNDYPSDAKSIVLKKKYDVLNCVVSCLLAHYDVDGIKITNGTTIITNYTNNAINESLEGLKPKYCKQNINDITSIEFFKYTTSEFNISSDIINETILSNMLLIKSHIDNSLNNATVITPSKKDALFGYVFHLDDYVNTVFESMPAAKDKEVIGKIKESYESDHRFSLFNSIFSIIKEKVDNKIISLGLDSKINTQFAFGHTNGGGAYFFRKESFDDFLVKDDLRKIIQSPSEITKVGLGLISVMQQKDRFGSLWAVFDEINYPEMLKYIKDEKELWEIEKASFFSEATKDDNIFFMGSIPFVSFDKMYSYVYFVGKIQNENELGKIRKLVSYASLYLSTIAESTANVMEILIEETDKNILKKHYVAKCLLGDELLKFDKASNITDSDYSSYLTSLLSSYKIGDKYIFDVNDGGWYGHYFSYAITEDVYRIALRLVNTIIKNFGIDKDLQKTLEQFYSFQETARANNLDYRDHLIHQFQVFLLGLKIMSSKWWQEFVVKPKGVSDDAIKNTYGIPWAIVALFHDIGYPFEKLEQVKIKYIENLLLLRKNEILPDKVSQNILLGKVENDKHGKELLQLYYEMIRESSKKLSINENELGDYYWFFKKLFVEERKHAVTSALFVYHSILNSLKNKEFNNEIASAILLHDKQIWMDALKSSLDIGLTILEADIIDPIFSYRSKLRPVIQTYFNDKDKSKKPQKSKFNIDIKKDPDEIDSTEIKRLKKVANSYYGKNALKKCIDVQTDEWAFVLHRIFIKEPLLQKHNIEWKHKICPKENPLQFLLLISDALQERGREMGHDVVFNEYFPSMEFEEIRNGLKISLKKSGNGSEYCLELLKIFVDLSLLRHFIHECSRNYYQVKWESHERIAIELTY